MSLIPDPLPSGWMEHSYHQHYRIGAGHRIIDLGAAYGEYALANYLDIVRKEAFVLMIEPSLDGAAEVIKWMEERRFTHGSLLTCGAWKEDSSLRIKRYEDGSCLGNKIEAYLECDMRGYWPTVPLLSLETLVGVLGGHVDFLKCDVEGAEAGIFTLDRAETLLKIDDYAIAAYHVVDGIKTCHELKHVFRELGYSVAVGDDSAVGTDHYEILYASKKPITKGGKELFRAV